MNFYNINKKYIWFMVFMTPLQLLAQENVEQTRNFLALSTNNPFFPILILIGFCIALLTFFKPRFGLIVMLFFMLISTDMQLDQSTEGRGLSIRIEDVILLIVTGGWLLNRAKTRSLSMFKHVPINKPVIFMALAITMASIIGYLQGTLPIRRGILFTLKRLEYFWLFFMALNIMESDKEVRLATKILLICTVAVSVIGAVQFYLFPLSGLAGGGATATTGFGRANTLADFYLIVGGVVFGLMVYETQRKTLIFYFLVAVCISIALFMTKSRGAYVSIPPLAITIVLVAKSKKVLIGLFVIGACLLLYFLMTFTLSQGSSMIAQGANMLTDKHGFEIEEQLGSIADVATKGPEADSSFYARYSSWINNIDNIFEYPLFGHGVGSVPLSYFDCHHVREVYETGFIGYIIFLYMNLSIFMTVLALFYMTEDPFIKGLTCGFLGGHVAMLIHGWSIANFYTIMNMEVFWFIVALIMILYHNHISSSREEEDQLNVMDNPVMLERS